MSRGSVCLVLTLVALGVVQARHEQYEGHRLFRLAGPAAEVAALDAQLDFWGVSRGAAGQLEAAVRLAPDEERRWLAEFEERGVSYEMISDNVANIFRKEDIELQRSRESADRTGRTMTWDTYYRHNEINDYIDSLGEQYPNLVTVVNAGLSYEARQIKYVRISTTRFETDKPVIVIDAAIHAREWVTTPVALYLIHQLVVERADERLTDQLDWVIMPCANPDGYEYTFTNDRLWRKTRSRAHAGAESAPACVGVDGNRNYDHHWGTTNATADPCTIVYEGPTAFSEPETRVVRNVVMEHLNRTALYISLHSYGNMFLYAWGNNGSAPDNGEALQQAGDIMADTIDALAIPDTQRYIVGNAAQVLYYSTGTSRDWTRSVGIPLTYTLELPGYTYFFEVPPTYVGQVVTETWAGIAAGGRHVLEIYGSGSRSIVSEYNVLWKIVVSMYCLRYML